MLKKDFPYVDVEFLMVDQQGGSTITMDSLLAAGDAPNIYFDSQVRTGKYLVAEYALDLKPNIGDLEKYDQEVLNPFRKKKENSWASLLQVLPKECLSTST